MGRRLQKGLVVFAAIFAFAAAIPIDNGVEGEPEIECGPTSVIINFNTRNKFEGQVYVKGLHDKDECRNTEGGRQVAGIELPFDTCNVARTRSLNPRGIFVTTTVVISFHPMFVTKVDRAYRIQCFYMEADKTVSTQLEVSDLTTALQTQVVPMPICRYEILDGGPTGEPIQFATIGQQVYHKWTCDSETVDTFCAVVHSCTVDDGNGDTVQILNEEGCALDKFLLNNLEYPTDLMAGQEAHVYKYADRSQLFYQCQISISIKEPNAECPRPQCPEPTGFNAKKQTPVEASSRDSPSLFRVLKKRQALYEETMDVRAELAAIEILSNEGDLPSSARNATHPGAELAREGEAFGLRVPAGVCLSPVAFSLLLSFSVGAIALLTVTAIYLARPNAGKAH